MTMGNAARSRSRTIPKASGASAVPGLADALGHFRLDTQRSYTVQVHEVLQQAIVRGTLPPGTPLSEAAIAEWIGVSRTPVREALAILAEDQLVRIYRQVGTIVAPIRLSLIEQGRFIRSTLECASHAQLATSITPEQLQELGRMVDRQRAALETQDVQAFSELDEGMHRRLFEYAGRDYVWPLLEPIKRQFDRVRWLLLGQVTDHGARALAEHEQLLQHLAARDAMGVGVAVAAHIDHINTHLAALRQKAPEAYFED